MFIRILTATNYKPVPSSRSTIQQRAAPKRSTSSVGKGGASLASGMGVRSVSVGMLNQAVGYLRCI